MRQYESSNPSGKLKGTAKQLMEKYMLLGKNNPDKIMSQVYFQYAEHYRRIENEY